MIQSRYFLMMIFLISMTTGSYAQTVSFAGWFATFHTYKLSGKTDFVFDGHLRSTAQVKQMTTIILRPGISYRFTKVVSVAVGYAFVESRREIGEVSGLVPEHRIWQHVRLQHRIKHISVAHRFRQEQRFIPKAIVENNSLVRDGYNYANRFRYYVRAVVPFRKATPFSKGMYAAVQNELFLNTGNKLAVNGRVFDQNRLYGAVGYRFSRKLDAEVAYNNQYSVTRSGHIINNHIAQITTYVNL